MNQISISQFRYTFYVFFVIYPFLINPYGTYYANGKAYILLGMALFIAIFNTYQYKDKLSYKQFKTAEWLLLLFFILVSFATLQSVKMSLMGNMTEHQGILVMLSYGILFLFASRLFPFQDQRKLLSLLIISSLFACIYGILQHFHLGFLHQDHILKFGSRSYSFFDNPDYFGSYLVLMLSIAMAFYLESSSRAGRFLYYLILCIQYIALLESETRSAWLGTGISFLLLTFFVVRKRKGLWVRWGMLMITFALIFSFVNETSHQTYGKRAVTITHDVVKIATNHHSGSAGASRWYIWRSSVPLIQKYFWFGSGPNTFREVYHPEDQAAVKKYIHGTIYDENNNYLQIALTMGVPSLLVYLSFILVVIRSGFQVMINLNKESQIIMYGLLAASVGYLVQAFFNISVVSVAPYFWLLLGFVYSIDKIQKI